MKILNRFKYIIRKIFTDSILKNSTYLITTNFVNMILGFFFWMIATRYYAPDHIGIISAVLSSIALISTVSLVGLPNALTLYLPIYNKNANRIINSCIIMCIVIATVVSLIFILGLNTFAPELKSIIGNFSLAVIFVITAILTTISFLMTGIYTAGKRSSYNMIKENIFGIIKIFFLVLFASFGVVGIFLSWSAGLMISMTVGFFLLSKLWRYFPKITFDPIIKNMATFSIGNYIAGIFYIMPKFIFPIMIIGLISSDAAGYFFIAMTIANLLYGVPESIAGPFLTESSDKRQFWNNVNKAIKFNIGVLTPGLLLFMIFGKSVLAIFNPNYADNSFTTLIILAVTVIPLSLVVIFNIIRNAQKRIMSTIIVNGLTTAITIILSVPFMKLWNIEGAALAYLFANVIMSAIIIIKTENPIGFISRLVKREMSYKGIKIINEI